jgi:hypothetical protein
MRCSAAEAWVAATAAMAEVETADTADVLFGAALTAGEGAGAAGKLGAAATASVDGGIGAQADVPHPAGRQRRKTPATRTPAAAATSNSKGETLPRLIPLRRNGVAEDAPQALDFMT